MHGVKAKNVIGYIMLPGIVPRLKQLFGSGFGYVAYLMAYVYNMVRLLPPGHPYLDPKNIGRFGIRQVVAVAASHLVISRNNIDQMIVFAALLAGIVIMALQFVVIIYSVVIQPVLAQSLFDTPSPEKDIAFLMLDNVFGVPGLFCNAAGNCTEIADTLPFPFHEALHDLLAFYSTGLLLVAVLIFLYFVVVVVAETATSGTPFGKRFQNVWAPVRLVVALGLLVPVHYGLNSAQYITLFAAKYGSGFATNGWLRFNNALASHNLFASGGHNPSGEYSSLLALPKMPDVAPTVQFASLIHGCRYAYWRLQNPDMTPSPLGPGPGFSIKPYLVKQPQPWMINTQDHLEVTSSTTYTEALDFYHNSDVLIVFGERRDGADGYKNYPGFVKPLCGEMRIQTADLSKKGSGEGTDKIQQSYFNLVKTLIGLGGGPAGAASYADRLQQLSYRFMEIALPLQPEAQCDIGCDATYELPACTGGGDAPCMTVMPSIIVKQEIINDFNGLVNPMIKEAWQEANEDTTLIEIPQEVKQRGWGGAGIWYNTIAKLNGSFITAVVNVPVGSHFPEVMEEVRRQKLASDRASGMIDQFKPNLSGGQPVQLGNNDDLIIAKGLYDMMVYWYEDGLNLKDPDKAIIGNLFEVAVNFIFGTDGLFAMRGENAHAHPLAQLTALGKGLVDRTIINVGISMGVATGIFDIIVGPKMAQIAGSIVSTTAFVGLTAGLVLFYVVPFLPFVYFYFAVGQWVKEIFEAMVGAPLWALAHMRIDGEGLPGDAASNGYFLIFEIFVRPIIIVMGLVAAMIIFTAQVRVLNFTWTLVVDNLTGFEPDITLPEDARRAQQVAPRGVIDQFFFTIIYAIIVYMLAMSSFKLIDSIPNNILRWMGAGVTSFADANKEEPAANLSRYTAISGMTLGQQAVKGTTDLASGLGEIVGLRGGGQTPPPKGGQGGGG